MFRSSCRTTGVLLAILAATACGGGGSDSTAPPSSQSIDVTLSSPQVTVMCGTTGLTTATLTRRGGYTGAVTIAVSGLPAGVAAVLSPRELSGDATSTTIMMTAAETVVPGHYTVTVTASSSVGTDTATYELLIVDTPHFHMTVEPSTINAAPGMSGSAIVNVARRGNFTGEVELSANAPAGLTVSFSPATITGTQGRVNVRAAATMPDGSYDVTVVATGHEVPTVTAHLALIVKASLGDWHTVAEPSELTVKRGGAGDIEVHVETAVEFPGWATYSLVNPPGGIYANFEYYYDWGYPATMTIYVPSTVAAGKYTLTLATSCPGIATKTITIGLTVVEP